MMGPFRLVGILCLFGAGCGSHHDAAKATDAQIESHEVSGTSPSATPQGDATSTPSPTASTGASSAPTTSTSQVSTSPDSTPTPTPSPTASTTSVPGNTATTPTPTPTPTSGTSTSGQANPNTTASATAIAWASLDFNDNPSGHDPKAVALTFDDGPDGYSGSGGTNNTGYILDQLKTLGAQATFFLCDHVWTDVGTDPLAQQDIQRMLSEGHGVGNHTLNHNNLSTMTATEIDAEFAQNATNLAIPQALGTVPMTMYRAPFGVPYEDNTTDVARIAPVTAKYGVHVGWGIETNDWDCAEAGLDANCIIDNLNAQLDAGRTGVILMHSVYRITGDALPRVIQSITAHGLHIVSVEQMIQDKYGMTSAQIAAANTNASFSSDAISTAAQNACSGNNFEIYAPYPNGTTGAE